MNTIQIGNTLFRAFRRNGDFKLFCIHQDGSKRFIQAFDKKGNLVINAVRPLERREPKDTFISSSKKI